MNHPRMTEPCRQQRRHVRDVQLVAVALQERDTTLSNGLQHRELDAVVDQLDEVSGPRGPRVHVAAGNRQRGQNWLDPSDRGVLAAGHEAGPAAGAFHAAAGAQIHEPDSPLAQPLVAPDGIAPV